MMKNHTLVGKTVTFTKMVKPKGKRKEVPVTQSGVVESVSLIGTREVATVEVASLFNGGMTFCEVVNLSDLNVQN